MQIRDLRIQIADSRCWAAEYQVQNTGSGTDGRILLFVFQSAFFNLQSKIFNLKFNPR